MAALRARGIVKRFETTVALDGVGLTIVLPNCTRRAGTPTGPGRWTCSLSVLIPSASSPPPQPTPIAYDLSINSNGCYKAQSPPATIGPAVLPPPLGREVLNPRFVIYGCLNTL